MLKKWVKKVRKVYWELIIPLLLIINEPASADSANPFPTVDLGGGNIMAGAGGQIQTGLKYGTIGIGGLLILGGIGVVIHSLREHSREKEHGNILMTIVIVALCEVIGFALIAIGWKAFNAQIT